MSTYLNGQNEIILNSNNTNNSNNEILNDDRDHKLRSTSPQKTSTTGVMSTVEVIESKTHKNYRHRSLSKSRSSRRRTNPLVSSPNISAAKASRLSRSRTRSRSRVYTRSGSPRSRSARSRSRSRQPTFNQHHYNGGAYSSSRRNNSSRSPPPVSSRSQPYSMGYAPRGYQRTGMSSSSSSYPNSHFTASRQFHPHRSDESMYDRFNAPQNNVLAVFGLDRRANEQDLFDVYRRYGCKECKIIFDKHV
jgi:hypothetical protein